MIVFIPCSADGCKPGEENSEWLPRRCPHCGQVAIIGHGRRWRQAHDRIHDWIRVRRGLCNECDCTLTVLPGWCLPRAHFSLVARQDTIRHLAEGLPVEQAAPQCRDPDRVADAATVRPWLGVAAHREPQTLDGCAVDFIPPTHPGRLGLACRAP